MPATIAPKATRSERLKEADERQQRWRKWGPYVSERQWGTVREDYSADGDAWNYFPHDHARSRAYRWGEDGIGGFCDNKQRLCLAVALWNGKDPILKERMFGLSNREGNHGEDVKELYYYLDATPTYSYARMLYKYPQAAFPYDLLVQENARRDRHQPEFEIIDTGIFDADRYFDVDIEYAKAGAEDVLLRLTVTNRGSEEAAIHVLPQVWFRNTWSWAADSAKPSLERAGDSVVVTHATLGVHAVQFERPDDIKFCENESNVERLFACEPTGRLYKDGLNDYVVHGLDKAVNSHKGTKAAGIYRRTIAAGASTTIRVRLSSGLAKPAAFTDFDRLFDQRKSEADAFYAGLQGKVQDEDLRRIQRQAFAGILWSKQFFYYDVTQWLEGDPAQEKPPKSRLAGRNSDWPHANMDRHRVDAGQMGVPVVRRLGLGLPSGHAGPARPRGRQASTDPAVPGLVHAPQRAVAGLRVELQRRQSAGAGLGGLATLRRGAAADRQGRSEVSRKGLHQAVAQFHLVGEPQGPARPERLRGRFPRHGQYRRLRPVGAACR